MLDALQTIVSRDFTAPQAPNMPVKQALIRRVLQAITPENSGRPRASSGALGYMALNCPDCCGIQI
jgi:hypothetical protein